MAVNQTASYALKVIVETCLPKKVALVAIFINMSTQIQLHNSNHHVVSVGKEIGLLLSKYLDCIGPWHPANSGLKQYLWQQGTTCGGTQALLWESASFYVASIVKKCRNVSRLCRKWKQKILICRLKADCLNSDVVLPRWRVCCKQLLMESFSSLAPRCCSAEQFRKEMEYAVCFESDYICNSYLQIWLSIFAYRYWYGTSLSVLACNN